MKIEELRKIADTAPVNLCIQVCRSHFEALIAVAEAARSMSHCNAFDKTEMLMWLGTVNKALERLESIE